jgi:predicted RND superfamily exporter protein
MYERASRFLFNNFWWLFWLCAFLVVFSQTKYRKMNLERIEKALPSQRQYRDDDDITSRTSVGNGHREMLPGEVDVE